MYNKYCKEYSIEEEKFFFPETGPIADWFESYFPAGFKLVKSDVDTNMWEIVGEHGLGTVPEIFNFDETVNVDKKGLDGKIIPGETIEGCKMYHFHLFTGMGTGKRVRFAMIYADLYITGSSSGIWDIITDDLVGLADACEEVKRQINEALL